MEDHLQQMIKDCSGLRHAEVRSVCQQVHDFLEAQQGTLRAPPHELRHRCLTALQLALESRNSKLISAAVCGFQKLLRDDRFHSNLECESEEQWMPSQLLTAATSLHSQPDDVQVDILNVLLNMACATWWSMNESVILRIIGTCRDSYVGGNLAVKIASQATASQTLRAFADHLDQEEKAARANPYFRSHINGDQDSKSDESVFDRVVPILHHLCTNLQQQQQQRNNGSAKGRVVPFYLESVLTLVSSLPQASCHSSTLLAYLWQTLCPTLLSLLGNPTSDKGVPLSRTPGVADIHSVVGRSSAKCNLVLTTSEVKTIFSICIELVRLVGMMATLRPMLESMFHRFLFHTGAVHRLEALRATKEIMKRPDRLLNFGGPPLVVDKKGCCSTDLGLLKLVVEAFVECSHCSDSQLCYASVDCVVALLDSLERICDGSGLSPEHISTLNSLYLDLDSCDYNGPMTYETWEKVQKIAMLMNQCAVSKQVESEVGDKIEAAMKSDDSPSVKGDRREGIDDVDNYDAGESEAMASQLVPCTPAVEPVEKNGEEVKDSGDGDPPSGYETDSSGSTEGPEEGFDDDQAEVIEDDGDHGSEVEMERRKRIPKTLMGKEECREEQERVARLYETRDVYALQERRNARHFTKLLQSELCSWLSIKSSIEADEILQEFASKYCEGRSSDVESNGDQAIHRVIVNADGVYLAIYTALLLNLNLIQSNYYSSENEPPLTEEEFIENVHGSGVLVYLSADWLAELYQQVLVYNFLENAGYDRLSRDNSALINLLIDLEGANGEHLLSDYYRLEKAVTNNDCGLEMEAGRKFARRVLTGCWDGVLEVLSALVNDKNAVGIKNNIGLMLGTESAKEEHRKARDAVASSLDGLQKAARLSNILNLHSRCETVFALLSAVSCPVTELQQSGSTPVHRRKLKSSGLLGRSRSIRIHMSHVLSMDVMLSRGLELGSYCPDCWKHVFRCCSYVADLEHLYFSQGVTRATASKTSSRKETWSSSKSDRDDFNDEDVPLPTVPFPHRGQPLSVAEYMKQNVTNLSSNGILSPEQTIQMICSLSHQVDRLFDDAAYKLNLRPLLGFLKELCLASQSALFSGISKRVPVGSPRHELNSVPHHYRGNMLLLHRLGDVMLKSVRSGRPLVHVMQSWSVIGLHLMEAACHKDQEVAKRAVACIHDIVSALLSSQSELPYFHFNEALFKPFENLLCLELCDVDVQDQIISSICEFVEGSKTEICSGWRPLFGALRAVRPSAPFLVAAVESEGNLRVNSSHVRAVIDVFDAFLNTDNILVFANAAVDCVLCLLKHIKGSGDNDPCGVQSPGTVPDLCLECLKCIHTCCGILASMHQMPACPMFLSSNRIQLGSASQVVDPDISGQILVLFNRESKIDVDATESNATVDSLTKNLVTLEELEQPSGILHVWCLVLEGLVGAVATFPRCYQPCTMETLFFLLHKIFELPGVEFGLYVINHILLPMMQSWLRRMARLHRGWDSFASNFKQCCGQTTDLVVDYLTKLSDCDQLQMARGGTFVLYQLLLLMTECISQPNESIARLGCSCIRHVIVASGSILTPDMWEVVCEMLKRACNTSLFNVRQLTVAFDANSDNFYGDVCQVKVAAKSDCSPQENERLKQLAQQVFLLDSQQSLPNGLLEESIDDDRSYVFLLYPLDGNDRSHICDDIVKVPFRTMVVGLVSHQILLQTIGSILLNGVPHVVPSLANILLQSPAPTPSSSRPPSGSHCTIPSNSESKPPGMVGHLSGRQVSTLLACLKDSYDVSCKFDERPGLKFLVQKVARSSAAANLYKQSGASWTIRTVALLEMCLHLSQFPVAEQDKSQEWVSELKATFGDVSVSYAELFLRKDDDQFARLQDQPIFFLVAQTDDYMEMRHKNDESKKRSDNDDVPASSDSTLARSPKEERGSEEAVAAVASMTESLELPEKAEDALDELRVGGDEEDSEADNKGEEEDIERRNSEDSLHVYEVATRKDIDTMVNEFKRRKQQHAMPSTKRERPKKSLGRQTEDVKVLRHRDETKLPSVLKDRHACVKIRTEMLLSIFDFLCQVDDRQFRALLPITFPFVRTLVAHGNDATLRQILAEFLDRIASLYCFAAEGDRTN